MFNLLNLNDDEINENLKQGNILLHNNKKLLKKNKNNLKLITETSSPHLGYFSNIEGVENFDQNNNKNNNKNNDNKNNKTNNKTNNNNTNKTKYDIIIRLRGDIYVKNPIPDNIINKLYKNSSDKETYIPKNDNNTLKHLNIETNKNQSD